MSKREEGGDFSPSVAAEQTLKHVSHLFQALLSTSLSCSAPRRYFAAAAKPALPSRTLCAARIRRRPRSPRGFRTSSPGRGWRSARSQPLCGAGLGRGCCPFPGWGRNALCSRFIPCNSRSKLRRPNPPPLALIRVSSWHLLPRCHLRTSLFKPSLRNLPKD